MVLGPLVEQRVSRRNRFSLREACRTGEGELPSNREHKKQTLIILNLKKGIQKSGNNNNKK
jgi:hypothetical protein